MRIGLISGDEAIQAPSLRYLSSYLNLNGHPTQFLFMRKYASAGGISPLFPRDFHHYSEEQLKAALEWARGFDLIGISCISLNAQRTHQLARALTKLGIPLIWGGAHASVAPEDCLGSVDIVCRGEGEEAIRELADRLEAGRQVHTLRNLWVRRNGKVHRNDVRPLVKDLDSLGGHDYHLSRQWVLDSDTIRQSQASDLGTTLYLNTIRGCPYSCGYCWWSFHHGLYDGKGPRVRKRTPESVVAEVRALTGDFPSVEHINFQNEDDFLYSLDEARTLGEGLRDTGLSLTMQACPSTLTREKLDAYVKGGLRNLGVGIQSGSDRVLTLYNRPMHQEQILEAARILRPYMKKITVNYQFLYNCCYETREDLLASLDLIARLPSPFIMAGFNMCYIPGTALHERAVRDGHITGSSSLRLDQGGYDLDSHLREAGRVSSPYLLHLFRWCTGTVSGLRMGYVPRPLFPLLTSGPLIRFFDRFPSLLVLPERGYGLSLKLLNKGKGLAARRRPRQKGPLSGGGGEAA